MDEMVYGAWRPCHRGPKDAKVIIPESQNYSCFRVSGWGTTLCTRNWELNKESNKKYDIKNLL